MRGQEREKGRCYVGLFEQRLRCRRIDRKCEESDWEGSVESLPRTLSLAVQRTERTGEIERVRPL